MKKMNNKGFSLVELIVVVLIMAIIAVALAPQVMKWVENSRKSTDIENYNALVEAANVASTNEDFLKVVDATGITITMGTSNTQTTGTGKSQFDNIMTETLPGWAATKVTGAWIGEKVDSTAVATGITTQPTATANQFTINVSKTTNGIKVVKTLAPRKNFS